MSEPNYIDPFDDDDYEEDDLDDEEDALNECGQMPSKHGTICQLAGTEYCDFECPYRDIDLGKP